MCFPLNPLGEGGESSSERKQPGMNGSVRVEQGGRKILDMTLLWSGERLGQFSFIFLSQVKEELA